jgi:hypothetical protein
MRGRVNDLGGNVQSFLATVVKSPTLLGLVDMQWMLVAADKIRNLEFFACGERRR